MTTIAQLRERPAVRPVYLCQIQLLNSGPLVYWGTRNISSGGNQYDDYIDSVSGIDGELNMLEVAVKNSNITINFNNTPWKSFAYLSDALESFPISGAAISIYEAYLDDNFIPSGDSPVLIFKGFLEEPVNVTATGFQCAVSARLYHYDQIWKQNLISLDTWPNAWEDLGKYEPIVYGSNVRFPCPRVSWGVRTTLQTALGLSDQTVVLSDPIQAGRLPATGSIWIDGEKITYQSKAGCSLSGCSRNASNVQGAPYPHNAGATVWQDMTSYDSIIATHLLTANVGTSFIESGIGPDSNPLPAPWTTIYGMSSGLARISNRVVPPTGGTAGSYYSSYLPGNNQFSECRVYGIMPTQCNSFGPAIRVSTIASTYYCSGIGQGLLRINKVIAGTSTILWQGNYNGFLDGDLVRLEGNGSLISLFYNRQLMAQITDTDIPGGYAGWRSGNNTTTNAMTDWNGGDLQISQLSYGDIFAEIQNELVRVVSGVSVFPMNGKTILRATSQISVAPVANGTTVGNGTLNLTQDPHTHMTTGAATQVWGTSGSAARGAWTNVSGLSSLLYDHNTGGSGVQLYSDGTPGTHASGSFGVNFGAPQGAGNWYVYATYSAGGSLGQGGYITLSAGGKSVSVGCSTFNTAVLAVGAAPGSASVLFNAGVNGTASCVVFEIWYEYSTSTITPSNTDASLIGSILLAGGPIATYYVDRFHITCNGYIADGSGNFGTAGSVIETPDNIIKHWLVTQLGIPIGDINAASFAAAASAFASAITGGYKLAFQLPDLLVPSGLVQALAFESRSMAYEAAGQFYLNYIYDIPPAPVKAISQSDLLGYFTFSKSAIQDLCNDITASYFEDYSALGSATPWTGTVRCTDAVSISKYGSMYHKDIQLKYVRIAAMAAHVVNNLLLRWKELRLVLSANALWEHFDLIVGQTFSIISPIYNGRLFYITDINRTDARSVGITANECWGAGYGITPYGGAYGN